MDASTAPEVSRQMPLWSAPAEVRIPPVLALDTVLAGLRPDTERMSGLDDPIVSADAQLGHAAHGDGQAERVGDPRGDAAPDLMQEDSTAEVEGSANLTVSAVARVWLARGRGQTGPWARTTRERYDRVIRQHIDGSTDTAMVAIGSLTLPELTVDVVADWSAANERVLARTTASLALLTLRQVCRFAVRRGWMSVNPVGLLEPSEKPRWRPGHVAVLEGDDLARVLDHAGAYRSLFELLAYSGLRIGECLGLTWADVGFDDGLLRVHRQLTRWREHGPLKTEAGRREVELAPAMVRLLRDEWLASPFKGPDDFVFTALTGRGRDYRHVGHNFRVAVRRSGVRADGRLSLHSLRHGYASLLIGSGLDVVYVSRQLGHANPNVTLGVYAHVIARREHAERAKAALEASHEAMTLARVARR
jgi:integrase